MYQMFDTGIIDIDSEEDYRLMEAIAHHLYRTDPRLARAARRAPLRAGGADMASPIDNYEMHAAKKYLEYTETPLYRAFRDLDNPVSAASTSPCSRAWRTRRARCVRSRPITKGPCI